MHDTCNRCRGRLFAVISESKPPLRIVYFPQTVARRLGFAPCPEPKTKVFPMGACSSRWGLCYGPLFCMMGTTGGDWGVHRACTHICCLICACMDTCVSIHALYVCMYVCMYVSMYVCRYIYICILEYVYIHIYVYSTYIYTYHACKHVYLHMCVCVHLGGCRA